jgi:hypothetical protein
MTKKIYKSPVLEITKVETESPIAGSGNYNVTLEDWKKDNTPDAPYDGDIWLNLNY